MEMLLLGAGASAGAGIPTSRSLTRELLNRLQEQAQYQCYFDTVAFVIGGLVFNKASNGESPYEDIDIEEVFSAIQLLGERNSLEISPFISTWHSRVNEIDEFYQHDMEGLMTQLMDIKFPTNKTSSIDGHLDVIIRDTIQAIQANYTQKSSTSFVKELNVYIRTVLGELLRTEYVKSLNNETWKASVERRGGFFRATATVLLRTLHEEIWQKGHNNLDYLCSIFTLLKQQKTLTVATLNYDNTMERAAKLNKISIDNGIKSWSKTGRFICPKKGIFLLKLHGSINWFFRKSTTSPMNTQIKLYPEHTLIGREQPAMVFGQRQKLRPDGPFIALLQSFEEELSKCDLLTVVGYSFRDEHVNVRIGKWLGSRKSNKLRIISKDLPDQKFFAQLKSFKKNKWEFRKGTAEQILPAIYGSFN